VVVLVVFELFFSKAITVAININIAIVGFRKIATEIEKNIPRKKTPEKNQSEKQNEWARPALKLTGEID
jgi:hypothetical protein